MRLRRSALFAAPIVLALTFTACAEQTDSADSADSTEAEESGAAAASCAPEDLPLEQAGVLTVATDSPAYEPWFSENDPSNGEGFESAVAYAVAEELGFTADQVTWVKQTFNTSYTPGDKKFDFDINQISITPERAAAVDFSSGYYAASQAVVTLKENAEQADSLDELKQLKLGAQTATTSLTAVREDVDPEQEPLVFEDSNQAKQALLNGQVDAIVQDLPTAFYMTSVELPEGVIAGQFAGSGDPEEFGLLLEKGSGLTECVDQAVRTLQDDGTLAELEQTWLSDVVDVPVLD
ncbi:ABC transporter substrate-binding protein [Nocardioides insulae]|uniref:ABC transporter substrate-binding protein n=1 Tax=Nocardioides insulae TaxID=394734 RepID=UPI000415285C|nr:ABC transporter substrate-binding protein [Nocardioides insulae]